jgi:hypothetical protein
LIIPPIQRWAGTGFADERPAKPVARIFKEMVDDSPSPWGEGWDEGENEQGNTACPKQILRDNRTMSATLSLLD